MDARHVAGIEIDRASLRRGGSGRRAVCSCGWTGVDRGSLEAAADDALQHEGSPCWVIARPPALPPPKTVLSDSDAAPAAEGGPQHGR